MCGIRVVGWGREAGGTVGGSRFVGWSIMKFSERSIVCRVGKYVLMLTRLAVVLSFGRGRVIRSSTG